MAATDLFSVQHFYDVIDYFRHFVFFSVFYFLFFVFWTLQNDSGSRRLVIRKYSVKLNYLRL